MKYRYGRNFCDCHPETCGCPPWAVRSPEGETVDTFWHVVDAEHRAKQLNKQLKLKKEADQAAVMTDIQLRKLVKKLVKQLQV